LIFINNLPSIGRRVYRSEYKDAFNGAARMSHAEQSSDNTLALKNYLKHKLNIDRLRHYGKVGDKWIDNANDYFWDEAQQDFRLQDLKQHGFLPGKARVLDIAAGCGQFLFRALEAGYDCSGIEPEKWKLDFIRKKNQVLNRPPDWADKAVAGVGENIPFPDNSFDCVTSYQTLEHVQSPGQVIAELIRVTRPGGGIFLRCPDYRSTFEAHYQLPWLPLFPKTIAKLYLRLLKRPAAGLDGIHYVTQPRILAWIRGTEKGSQFSVSDENRIVFENGLRRRGIPNFYGAYLLYTIVEGIRDIGRREKSVNLFVRIAAH
jgi:ubiquinone/menaquinone biosynthesis C-methylase UbiE